MVMKKNKKIRKYILIVIALCVLGYITFFFYQAVINDPNDPIVLSNIAPSNYVNLFSQLAQHKLRLKETMSFKLRGTISFFYYDEKYDLEVTKIKMKPGRNLKNDVVETYTKPDGKVDYSVPFHETQFTTNYKDPSTESISKIFLSLHGDSAQTITKNDSIASYYLKLKNVTVQYNQGGVKEIFIDANTSDHPINLMFLKRSNSLYFLLLAPKDNDTKLNPDLLNNIVSTK
jgi:hypothetical protein